MLALLELKPLPRQQCSHRESTCDPLGKRYDIRQNACVLDGEPFAGPAHPRLDFVDDHERAFLVTDLTNLFEESCRWDDDPCLTLNGLDDDPGRITVNRLPERISITIIDECPCHAERLERLADSGLVGDCEGSYCPSVEAVSEGNELLPPGSYPGEFECSVACLRSGVREEGLRHSRLLCKFLCKLCLARNVIEV
ncbi:MAG: hypothetical protein A4E42_02313 [Methanoregulaceae archaeon PtaU1.Bin222]|nr:MAG: hypothetical protein A4E42_02313 [Methanoregulaceae archaeon PtaU1.Bin222]